MKNLLKNYFLIVVATFLGVRCSNGSDDEIIKVTSVMLDKTDLSLIIGETDNLIATVNPSNASNKSLIWESNKETVATIDNSGIVTAVGAGNALIKATSADGGISASCYVTVSYPAVSGVEINKNQTILTIGETETLTATVLPESVYNINVLWSSSNETVAYVNGLGEVKAMSEGTAIITATTQEGGFTATCEVVVNTIHVTGISLDVTSRSILNGLSFTLTPTITPGNASNKSVTWASNNPSVAKVNQEGVVTTLSKGSAVITATTVDGGYYATCAVSVYNLDL